MPGISTLKHQRIRPPARGFTTSLVIEDDLKGRARAWRAVAATLLLAALMVTLAM
jgi:hypothetical protein